MAVLLGTLRAYMPFEYPPGAVAVGCAGTSGIRGRSRDMAEGRGRLGRAPLLMSKGSWTLSYWPASAESDSFDNLIGIRLVLLCRW